MKKEINTDRQENRYKQRKEINTDRVKKKFALANERIKTKSETQRKSFLNNSQHICLKAFTRTYEKLL